MNYISIDVETAGLIRKGKVPPLLCVGYARDDGKNGVLKAQELDQLKELANGHIAVFHNASFDVPVLSYYGQTFTDYEDTQLMSYVLNPGGQHSLESWGVTLENRKHEKPWKGDYPTEYSNQLATYCRQDARLTLELFHYLKYKLMNDERAFNFYNNVELPYSCVIQEMEATGLYVDSNGLQKLRAELEIEVSRISSQLRSACPRVPGTIKYYKNEHPNKVPPDWKYYGQMPDGTYKYQIIVPFNPNSNDHKAYALKKVDKVKLEATTASGKPKVDSATLEEIGTPFAQKLVELGKINKIISGFLIPLSEYQDEKGFVRGNFNQTVTLTGRLSSSNPNLQNIPRRGELGSKMRQLITVPDDNTVIVNGDLSNIEARVLAWMLYEYVGDSSLANKFINKEDFHSDNAASWDISRDDAKTVLFAIVYGATEHRISKVLKISLSEARQFIKKLERKMPSLFELRDLVIEGCINHKGVLHSLFGRRLVYPEITSKNKWERSAAERQIFNAYIQGTAGDILKSLTLNSMQHIRFYGARIAASVHDEVLIYCPKESADELINVLNTIFNDDKILAPVPIVAEFRQGKTWKESH